MPALSFQKQFLPFIESGEKRHTIRAHRARPFKVGDKLSLFYGMRTKQCRRLFDAPCVRVQQIQIDAPQDYHWTEVEIVIDGETLAADERELLALADGFKSFEHMVSFWDGRLPFSGQIIHWDFDKRELPR